MKKIVFTGMSFTLVLLTMLYSCRKTEQVDASGLPFLGGDNPAQISAIDGWIKTNLNTPFNIQVKYKRNDFDASLTSALVPMLENKVIPALTDIKSVFIDPYMAIGGEAFFKPVVPKEIVMVGSPSFNSDNTITLGEAEGGLKILLYDMNRYDPQNNVELFMEKMHTIHHEFAHILHQTKAYDPAFKTITAGGYTGNWNLTSDEDAYKAGFVTAYARSNADDDFVETVATLLVAGQGFFEGIIASLEENGNTTAIDALRRKEQIVHTYYKEKWNIDFAALQLAVGTAISKVYATGTGITDWYGSGKFFKSVTADSTTFKTLSAGSIKDSIAKIYTTLNTVEGEIMLNVIFAFSHPDTLVMTTRTAAIGKTNKVYVSNYRFKASVDANGTVALGPVSIQGQNEQYYTEDMAPILSYLLQTSHIISWNAGSPVMPMPTNTQIARFTSVTNPQSYFIGQLDR